MTAKQAMEIRSNPCAEDVDNKELRECIDEALEKQIPKKPEREESERGWCMECPECDSFLGYEVDCKDEHYQPNYCEHCGQALEW